MSGICTTMTLGFDSRSARVRSERTATVSTKPKATPPLFDLRLGIRCNILGMAIKPWRAVKDVWEE